MHARCIGFHYDFVWTIQSRSLGSLLYVCTVICGQYLNMHSNEVHRTLALQWESCYHQGDLRHTVKERHWTLSKTTYYYKGYTVSFNIYWLLIPSGRRYMPFRMLESTFNILKCWSSPKFRHVTILVMNVLLDLTQGLFVDQRGMHYDHLNGQVNWNLLRGCVNFFSPVPDTVVFFFKTIPCTEWTMLILSERTWSPFLQFSIPEDFVSAAFIIWIDNDCLCVQYYLTLPPVIANASGTSPVNSRIGAKQNSFQRLNHPGLAVGF